jgi:hypothetical protein
MKKISCVLRSKTYLISSPIFKQLSIIKNKDQKGEHDKSYSGTDSRHLGGSNRVLDEDDKPSIVKVVSDASVHHNINTSGSDFGKENINPIGKVSESFGITDKDTKAQMNQSEKNSKKENQNLTPPEKQEKF